MWPDLGPFDLIQLFISSNTYIYRYSKKQNSNQENILIPQVEEDLDGSVLLHGYGTQNEADVCEETVCNFIAKSSHLWLSNSQICRREETTILENVVWLKTPACARFSSPDQD